MKLLIHISLILLPFYSFSQGIYNKKLLNFEKEGAPCNLDSLDGEPVYDSVEVPASYEGGMGKFYKAVGKTLHFDPNQKNNFSSKIYITFIVDKEGNIRNVCTNQGITIDCINDLIELTSGKWTPAQINGLKVHQKIVLVMNIHLG
ncbi:hypothetical protein KMW28_17245 [Flammeovirga yaeyamensis]|uniref:TonB C-terminal domain-containing protein n=1 Tax=Flammeovirga yaeyamensis TaxID=367791 RepID=A0AAX1N1F7_9BACT|nr:hypothetical protein [Flammeovirga yaeyamensis]MBB3698235.1 hypothetical protein [Flammeovirga yaeyamensis]NMF34410.1 hypothetical protein [Flammeovirga yaeyamensis]QWG01390.1 hypothetical protein KMW28_17245 [Flammeovirga yaeyamensis]